MPRWLVVSLAIVVAQLVLALGIGALLRRASVRARRSDGARSVTLPFPRLTDARRRSAWRRAVGL